MFIDYARQLASIEIVLLIHMAGNVTAIHAMSGWMAKYASRQARYLSSIPSFLCAALFFGLLAAFGFAIVIPSGSHSAAEVAVQIAVPEATLLFMMFAANSENRMSLNDMKEKLDSFPGWRYWFDDDKQSQLVSALHVAITRDRARDVPFTSAAETMLVFALSHMDTLAHTEDIPPNAPEANYFLGQVFLFVTSTAVLARINRAICERLMPGAALMDYGLAHITRPGRYSALHLRISRWRNPEHQRLFQLANALEKCIYPVRRRVSAVDFDTVSTAFSALALAVRNEAVRFSSERSLRPEVLSWMCITLAVNTNPVRSAKRVAALLPNEVSLVQPLPKSRVSDVLGRVNDALAQNTRAFVALAAIFVLAYCLATGNIAKLFEFLRSVAAS